MSTRTIGSITNSILQLNGLKTRLPEQEKSPEALSEAPEFIHPIITKEGFRKTLDNYRLHIKKYNVKVWMENAQVRSYNQEVIRHRKTIKVSTEQKIREQAWKEERSSYSAEEYNQEVEKYNAQHGLQLRKKNLRQEVKPATEKFFVAFLHQYNMQLFNRKRFRTELGVNVPGELPKFDLYPNKIVEAQRNGCPDLPVSVETVRHHRERLQEAGVLTGYQYRGPNRAVKIAFNPAVLTITDNKTPKNTPTGNQRLTEEKTNKVPHNNVSSRNHISDKFQVREEGASQSSAHKDCTRTSTKTPKRQKNHAKPTVKGASSTKKNQTGPRENYTISEILAANLDEKRELAQDLSSGKHNNYQEISPKIAQNEAYYGALHPDDFREVAIQDIFKFSASIFSNLENTHPGSWMNAIKLWMALKFKSFTGKTLSKPNIYEKWQETILVLKEVKKFQKNHPDWQPHYPSLYFDPARTHKENNSLEYALRHFRVDTEEVESFQKRKAKAEKSKRYKTDVKKAREKIRLYLHGKISLDEVYDYVKFNCGKSVFEKLGTLIKKEFKKENG